MQPRNYRYAEAMCLLAIYYATFFFLRHIAMA